MSEFTNYLRDNFQQFGPADAVDVLLVAAIFYWLLLILKNTTGMALLRGIAIVLIAAFALARALQLQIIGVALRYSFTGLLIALLVIFQPEIRRALERVGRTGLLLGRPSYDGVVDVLTEAACTLAQRRHGALIVLERDTGLQDYIETGVPVDGMTTAQLLEGIFYPNSPLHDGAVIIRENRVLAAACTLPLSERGIGGDVGTRHRAGLGITEQTDAVSLIVSEETGHISVAADGRFYTPVDDAVRLRGVLAYLLRVNEADGRG